MMPLLIPMPNTRWTKILSEIIPCSTSIFEVYRVASKKGVSPYNAWVAFMYYYDLNADAEKWAAEYLKKTDIKWDNSVREISMDERIKVFTAVRIKSQCEEVRRFIAEFPEINIYLKEYQNRIGGKKAVA